jgi:AcrR family transcriptional regulator
MQGAPQHDRGDARRPYHHGDLPAALLDAVAWLIREQGLEAVTLRAAARRAGVSHAAPAHHFGDKSGLIAAFAHQGFDRFADALHAARRHNEGSPADGLRAMAHAYLAFARDHRPWFDVMFRPELVGEHLAQLADHGSGSFRILLDQVTDCFEPGISQTELLGFAVSAWATVHGLAQLLVDGPLESLQLGSSDALTDAVTATLLQGMRAHRAWVGDTLRLAPPDG